MKKHSPSRKQITAPLAAILILAFALLIPPSETAQAATSWNYTALGDSLAVGLWAVQGYVPRYEQYIESDAHVDVTLVNLGQLGWTSGQLLTALQTNWLFRYSVSHSRVVTWDIGGNDFLQARTSYRAKTCGGTDNQNCIRQAVATFKTNWQGIIATILTLRRSSNTIIRTMTLYDPYVAIDMATDTWAGEAGSDFAVFKPYEDDVNAFIASTAAAKHIRYADVYHAFNGACGCQDPVAKGYISFDGLHPNDTGHRVIAQLLRGLGYAPLR